MKVNPLAPDEKSLLNANTKSLASGLRGKTMRKNEKFKCQEVLKVIVEGKIATVVMSLDDIRIWATEKDADPFFYGGLIVSFLLFVTEILINSIVLEDFKYSFFFWLDLIATFSLIPDIRWIVDALGILVGTTPSYESVNAIAGVIVIESNSSSQIQKVVKSLRLIRLIRIIKLYKYIVNSKKQDPDSANKKKKVTYETTTEEGEDNSLFAKETDPSKLGKALSDTITRRVIIGVLLMLMILPLLTYSEIDYSSEYGLRELFWFGRSTCIKASGNFFCEEAQWATKEGWEEMLRQYTDSSYAAEGEEITKKALWIYVPDFNQNGRMDSIKLIPSPDPKVTQPYWQQVDSCAGFQVSDSCPYRYEEMDLITYIPSQCLNDQIKGCEQLTAYARMQKRPEKIQEAILQFSTTLFTCVVLTVASLTFANDAQQIVIKPIQKIVEIIQRLAENPLKKPNPPKKDEDSEKSQMKTQMLELTIFKISTLLQRGFGEIGARTVARTFTHDEDYMNLIIPGKKRMLVFAICRIRQFTETTECLQDEIIVFVNKIVKIVHEVAKKWEGMPTKNFGDKYLLTWRLPMPKKEAKYFKQMIVAGQGQPFDFEGSNAGPGNPAALIDNSMMGQGESSELVPRGNQSEFNVSAPMPLFLEEQDPAQDAQILEKSKEVADRALIAAVKIVVELRRALDLQAYSRHPKIAPKFGQNYRTKVTFGLHAGWAIEGAVGTEQKIDALFLSPDSSISMKIEDLCSRYETTILVSGDLHKLLSDKGKSTLRCIDNVVMDESKTTPKEIYSFDCNFSEAIEDLPNYYENFELGGLIKHQEFENTQPEVFTTDGVDYMFMIDHDFYTFQRNRKEQFEANFKLAYDCYITGDWPNAQNYITQCLEIFTEDGPCLELSDYMERFKNQPPEAWPGYRNIDEKDAAPNLDFIKAGFDDEIMDDDNEELDDDDSLS